MKNSNNKSASTFDHLIEKSHRITKLKRPCLRSKTVSCGLWMAEKQLKPKNTVLSLLMQSTTNFSQGYFCHYGRYNTEAQSHSEQNNLRKILSWNLFASFYVREETQGPLYAMQVCCHWAVPSGWGYLSLNCSYLFPLRLFVCLLFSSTMTLNLLELNFGVLNLASWCETQHLHQHTCETHWCSSIQADQVG